MVHGIHYTILSSSVYLKSVIKSRKKKDCQMNKCELALLFGKCLKANELLLLSQYYYLH